MFSHFFLTNSEVFLALHNVTLLAIEVVIIKQNNVHLKAQITSCEEVSCNCSNSQISNKKIYVQTSSSVHGT